MRTLDQMLAALPVAERIRIEAAYWGMVLDAHAAQGMETAKPLRHEVGSARKGDSPVAEGHAPNPSRQSNEGVTRG